MILSKIIFYLLQDGCAFLYVYPHIADISVVCLNDGHYCNTAASDWKERRANGYTQEGPCSVVSVYIYMIYIYIYIYVCICTYVYIYMYAYMYRATICRRGGLEGGVMFSFSVEMSVPLFGFRPFMS